MQLLQRTYLSGVISYAPILAHRDPPVFHVLPHCVTSHRYGVRNAGRKKGRSHSAQREQAANALIIDCLDVDLLQRIFANLEQEQR